MIAHSVREINGCTLSSTALSTTFWFCAIVPPGFAPHNRL
jgi:hypothetical protein